MQDKQTTALIIIMIYMLLTIGIGFFVSWRNSKKEQSNEDFLMAGKSLGPVVLAATLFAANTGGASTTGIATNVFKYGLSASWYVIAAGIGFVLVSFIAPYFRRAAASTVPEIIKKRYGKNSHIITAITSIGALFMATGAQILATATVINAVTGFDFNIAAIITTIVVIGYTMIGGFASVAAANMMHVSFITVGMTIVMFIIVRSPEVGGFANLFAQAREITGPTGENLNLVSMTKIGLPTIIGYLAMYFMTYPTGQEIVQTFSSAKDGKSAKFGSIIAGFISSAYAIVPAIIGLVGYTFIDGFAMAEQPSVMAETTLTFAPGIAAGIVLAAICAATISSASGNMIGTATMFTNDIFRPYINKGITDDKKEVWVSRIVMLVVGMVGLIISISAQNIIAVMMGAFALRSAGPFAAFICGLFYKKVTQNAGFISIIAGTVMAGVWIYALNTPWDLNSMVPGAIVAFIVIFSVSYSDRKRGVKPAPMIELDAE